MNFGSPSNNRVVFQSTLVDSTTNEGYVIMRADQYEKVKVVFEREVHDFDPREAYPFVDEAIQADHANDPTLET